MTVDQYPSRASPTLIVNPEASQVIPVPSCLRSRYAA